MTKRQITEVFSKVTPILDCTLASSSFDQKGIYLFGIPFDKSASFRRGARLAPNAIRKVSYQLETYSPYLDSDLEDHSFFDLGNAKIRNQKEDYKRIANVLKLALQKENKFLTIGGDHSISIAPIWAYQRQYSNLTIIHLDAHADLRESYENNPHSHASIIARVCENSEKIIQYGIRSGTREEFQKMHSMQSLLTSQEELFEKVSSCQDPIYLTLDLDFFDPSILSGTGTPEAGGESFQTLVGLLKILRNKQFVGADITELAPNLDNSGNSTIFASKVVREILLCLALS